MNTSATLNCPSWVDTPWVPCFCPKHPGEPHSQRIQGWASRAVSAGAKAIVNTGGLIT